MWKVDFQFLTLIFVPRGNHGVDKEKLPFQKICVPKKSVGAALLFIQGFWLYWKFSKNFYPKHWLENFFWTYIWFALFAFSKNILVHVVTAGDLVKFSMHTSATAKTKSCSFNNNKFHCCLGACFQGFKKFEEIFRFIYLECFFVWCVFFKWQRKYFYQLALLAISFVYFHFDHLIRIHTH